MQLHDYIQNLNEGNYDFFDSIRKKEKITVYPIVVVTDETACTLGFNRLLNFYFDENKKEGYLKSIKPITLIHIDDLIKYQTYLKKLHIVIDSYHSYVNKKDAIDEMISFSDYLNTELLVGKSIIRKNDIQHLLENSLLPKE